MGDSLNNRIRVLCICLLVMHFSSCERKKLEAQKDHKEEQTEAIPKQARLEEGRRHPFLEEFSNQSPNKRKPSAKLLNSALDDTGIDTPEPELPAYASAVVREFKSELEKNPSEEASRLVLSDLAKKYWLKSFEKNISLDGTNFSNLFRNSEKLIQELRTGGNSLDLSDDELKASYALYVVMSLFSQGTNSEVDRFFKERMNATTIQIGDLLLARIASQVKPFKGSDSVNNIKMLEEMGSAKNPVYRALAVSSGKVYFKNENRLFDFYRKFEKDPQVEISALVLDELARLDSEAAFLEIGRIMRESKGNDDPIYIHAKKLIENKEQHR